ncbi:N-acetylglucosamine-6-phosphate deacetylase [Paenibacillus antri]|uniref:N-acetylglucosamine-6-phosphate deacetylase n=1 Tax=Paenibacillus antri TaxID=2582848 RepID=A0A5R9GBZ6_9BACL|nr:amidohydrolase family protein [Paenibacillus antri]TLS53992.1 N-acetylglucosamine-6-phosphate deacetylase [Paenibacillus antri]
MSRAVVEGRLLGSGAAARVVVDGGRVASVESIDDAEGLPWIAPGLVDLQVNGYAGIDFNTTPLATDDVKKAVRLLLSQGVTTVFPTVITNGDEAIEASMRSIAAACREDALTGSCVGGIHLEGPFLSPVDGSRGAHEAAYVRAPDWDAYLRWQEAAEGRIRILTMSPEWDGAADFISRVARTGTIVSIGHTAATPEQIREAVQAGARMSTHLGNAAQLMLPRHPNYIWEQLAADELTACVIPDGFHLPDSVLKVFLRAKAGRIALVSDAVYLSGLAPGAYRTHIGGDVVLTPEGRLHLASNPKLLAGSAQMLVEGVGRLAERGLCTLDEAWALASAAPAEASGLEGGVGTLSPGSPADLVLFRLDGARVRIEEVYKNGTSRFRQNGIGSSGSA